MPLAHHPLPRSSARRDGTRLRQAGRFVPLLRSAAVKEPIFSVCVMLVGLHLAVLALLLPGRVSALLPMAMLVCAVLGTPVLVVWFSQLGRAGRVVAGGLVGLAATVAGLATSVPHALLTGPGGSDYTGMVATAAGVVLIVLAFRDALRGRRTAVKLMLAIPAALVMAQWLIAPAIKVGIITNAPRPVAAGAATLGLAGARDVSFPASDGVRLAGWYVPGRNGAAVILLHGSHGTRSDTLAHLRMLHAAGYGVLAFDARGHGQSRGDERTGLERRP